MTYNKIKNEIESGKTVVRSIWQLDKYVHLVKTTVGEYDIFAQSQPEQVDAMCLYEGVTATVGWAPSEDDLSATDWEIL